MDNLKTVKGLLISSACILALAGCNGNVTSSSPTGTQASSSAMSNAAASLETGSFASDKEGTSVLYIGEPDHLKEVAVQKASTAEELIEALTKETGWNLTLAQAPSDGELQGTLKIAFAAESAVYNAPPEPQKDSYHVFDSEEYVLTVLNSVSETLCRNLDLGGVYFTSPDGGVLTLTNGGYSFCFSNIYCWDYDFARECNEPLPQDNMGLGFVGPNNGPIVEGPNILEIVFKRSNVQQMPGTLTIYNEDGSVRETIAADDTTKVRSEPVPDFKRNYYNLKEGEGTFFQIFPAKDFEAGDKYSVDVSAGAFTAEDGLEIGEITKDVWSFYCIDMKLTVTPKLGNAPVIKIGEPITYHFQFSDDVKRVYVQEPEKDADYSCSTKELISDGDIVFTPRKSGKTNWIINVELKDGNIIGLSESPTVIE